MNMTLLKTSLIVLASGIVIVVIVSLSRGINSTDQISSQNMTMLESQKSDSVHFHAAFHHYKDGVLQDYSGFEFMSVIPCGLDEPSHDTDNLLEQVHLHDGNGEVVHVHVEGITWRHLFSSLGIEVSNEVVYVDERLVSNGLDQLIGEYERALILENTDLDKAPMYQLLPSQEAIRQAESASELCGS